MKMSVSLYWKCPKCGVPITSNETENLKEFHKFVEAHM